MAQTRNRKVLTYKNSKYSSRSSLLLQYYYYFINKTKTKAEISCFNNSLSLYSIVLQRHTRAVPKALERDIFQGETQSKNVVRDKFLASNQNIVNLEKLYRTPNFSWTQQWTDSSLQCILNSWPQQFSAASMTRGNSLNISTRSTTHTRLTRLTRVNTHD